MDTINAMPRYWLVRLFLSLQVVILSAMSIYQPETQLYRLIAASGGQLYVFALLLLACVAVLDTLVNDIFPDRWRLQWALRHRHVIYMLIAIGTAAMAVTFFTTAPTAIGAYLSLALTSAMSSVIAFLDVFARHRP